MPLWDEVREWGELLAYAAILAALLAAALYMRLAP